MGSTLDLINTFAALSGTKIPTDRKMDGYDLSPVLKGTGPSPRNEFYFWTRAKLRAARQGQWKVHVQQSDPVNYGKVVELEHPELYNLETDISEKYDLYSEQPEILKKIQALMKAHEADMSDALPDNLAERIEVKE